MAHGASRTAGGAILSDELRCHAARKLTVLLYNLRLVAVLLCIRLDACVLSRVSMDGTDV